MLGVSDQGSTPPTIDAAAASPPPAAGPTPRPWRWPTIIGFAGTSLYLLASFLPFSKTLGASYPFVDFDLPRTLWLVPLGRDIALTGLRVAALIAARSSARWSRVGWGALTALGATGAVAAVSDMIAITSAGPAELTLGSGVFVYLIGSLMVLAAGLLGLTVRDTRAKPVDDADPLSAPDRTPNEASPAPVHPVHPVHPGQPFPATPPRPDVPRIVAAPLPPRRSLRPAWTDPRATRRTLLIATALAMIVPLGIAPATARGHDGAPYAFTIQNADGSPVRWNPCQAIHYVVNAASAPAGIDDTIRDAVHEVGMATGISIVSDGSSSEQPVRDATTRRDRFPDLYPPVLIAWDRQGTSGIRLNGNLGVTIPDYGVLSPGRYQWVSSEVVLNATANLQNGFGSPHSWGPVLLHELGHVLGLGHVGSVHQIMHPGPTSQLHYGWGDLEGLRRLGRSAGCLS
jgi:hypothetical protein